MDIRGRKWWEAGGDCIMRSFITCTLHQRNRDSSVVQRWATGLMVGTSSPATGREFFFSPPRPDQIWGQPNFLSNGYQRLFHWE
jgi:hypothetical protein